MHERHLPSQFGTSKCVMGDNDRESVHNQNEEVWKAFGSDTEAGRLLKKLYGGSTKPQIAYPKVRTKVKALVNSPFVPAGGKAELSSRSKTHATKTSDRAINVPTFRPGYAATSRSYVSRGRKPLSVIEREWQDMRMQLEAYRRSCPKTKPPNQDKEKLQHTFSYTNGNILPSEMLPGADLLQQDLSHANNKLHGNQSKDRLTQLYELYDAVMAEIEDRKQYMQEMVALGQAHKVQNVEEDMLHRMTEVRQVDKLIAEEKKKQQQE